MSPSILNRRSLFTLVVTVVASVAMTGVSANGAESYAKPAQRKVKQDTPSVESLLWLLPEDTESILVSTAQMPIEASYSMLRSRQIQTRPPIREEDEFANGVASLGAEPFWNEGPSLPREEVTYPLMRRYFQGNLKLVLVAGRNRNIWSSQWERCAFVVFRNPVATEVMREWSKFAVRRHTIGGYPVLEFDAKQAPGDPPIRKYVVSTAANTILTSPCLDMINTVLDRLKRRGKNRALPESLPEWKHVNTSAKAWGLRHYASASYKSDPFSMPQYDKKAQGMVIHSDENPPHSIVLRYISPASDAEKRFSEMLEKCHGNVAVTLNPIHRTTPDRLEAKYIITKGQEKVFPPKPLTLGSQTGELTVGLFFAPLFGIPSY